MSEMEESSAISLAPFDVLCRKDSAVYKNLTTVDLEVLLTQTILQTFYGLHAKVLEIVGHLKHVQQLQLVNVQVMGVDFAIQSWPSLWYLSLFQVVVLASDYSPLLACPKLGSLVLTNPTILSLDARSTLTLTSSSLREFTTVDDVSLEAEVLASLELDRCTLQHFGLVSKGKLRKLTIKRARIPELDIRPETSTLQALHVSNSTIPWPGFG
ncbi:unnamed protein product [Sphagnum troendelagicum]|uniref:Uncharacterized protein n=1 Tax=Sphagnum troendelagicum TaxID=128251 RepID=A0ABP0THC0_9BRYO